MNSHTVKLIIAVCLLVPFLVILNLGLWSALRRRNTPNSTRMIQQARLSIRHPWNVEDQKLKELSERVASMKDRLKTDNDVKPPDETPPSGGPGS